MLKMLSLRRCLRFVSRHSVGCLGLAEKVFSGFLFDQPGTFQFEVSALDLTAIDGEFLASEAGEGKASPEVICLPLI